LRYCVLFLSLIKQALLDGLFNPQEAYGFQTNSRGLCGRIVAQYIHSCCQRQDTYFILEVCKSPCQA
jgi:hypothetical protein